MSTRERMPNEADDERDPVIETIAIFSDRLRTPLTAISAQVAMLLDGDYGSLSPEQRKALEVVQRNDSRLLHVIEDAERSLARSTGNLEGHPAPASREPKPIPRSLDPLSTRTAARSVADAEAPATPATVSAR